MTITALFPSTEDVAMRQAALKARMAEANEWIATLRACSTPEELAAIVFDKIKEMHNAGEDTRLSIEWDEERLEPWVRQHVDHYDTGRWTQIHAGAHAVGEFIHQYVSERLDHDIIDEVWVHPNPYGFPSLLIIVESQRVP